MQKEQQKKSTEHKIDYLRTICGVFLNGKAVCEGYARAMQYLLQKCGIECAEIVGHVVDDKGEKGEAHAWNLLKIDGDYYHLDATWDNGSNTVQTVKSNDVGFSYFCVTTDEITRSRNLDLVPVAISQFSAVKGNYYYHNDFVLESYDINKIKEMARTPANNGAKAFLLKFKCNKNTAKRLNIINFGCKIRRF